MYGSLILLFYEASLRYLFFSCPGLGFSKVIWFWWLSAFFSLKYLFPLPYFLYSQPCKYFLLHKPLCLVEILISWLKILNYSKRLRWHVSLHAQTAPRNNLGFMRCFFQCIIFAFYYILFWWDCLKIKIKQIQLTQKTNRPTFCQETKIICLSQSTSPIINSHWPQSYNLAWVPNCYRLH